MTSQHRQFQALYAQIVPQAGFEAFICRLADAAHVSYRKTVGDQFAEHVTRLSGDEVKLDKVERLLLALDRAGYVPPGKFVPLQVAYLREKLGVRSA